MPYFPLRGVKSQQSGWVRKTHVASTGDIDWERKATATASRGNNKAINNKAKCWGGALGEGLVVRGGERKPLPTRTTGADGVVLVGCFWVIVPLEAQQ